MIKPPFRKPWHAEAKRLWALGWSTAAIGAKVGMHRNTVLRFVNPDVRMREFARRKGFSVPHMRSLKPPPAKSRKATEQWHHDAKALCAEIGPYYAEIARRLGINEDRVRRFLDRDAHVRYVERQKDRYKNDPEYRDRCKARANARAAMLRAQRQGVAQQNCQI